MEELIKQIQTNLTTIQAKIDHAALRSGRNSQDVQLVVVTKSQPLTTLEAAVQAGVHVFGENYPEETLPKILALKGRYAVEWHMIGHLQSRKAAIVAEHFNVYQSLDRVEIALKLEQHLSVVQRRIPVLLEFNMGGETSKSGWDAAQEGEWEKILPDIQRIQSLAHLEIRGLMTMPPLVEDPEQARNFFSSLRRLRDFLSAAFPHLDLHELSMGTSADFECAIEEGATLVRIGSAIVGPRAARIQPQPPRLSGD